MLAMPFIKMPAPAMAAAPGGTRQGGWGWGWGNALAAGMPSAPKLATATAAPRAIGKAWLVMGVISMDISNVAVVDGALHPPKE